MRQLSRYKRKSSNDFSKCSSSGTGMDSINEENFCRDGWPADFDFKTDPLCQTVFKPFIEEQLEHLENYDGKRNHLSDYRFHVHAVEAAQDVKKTCIRLGLGKKVANNLYHATLIHDLGKPELDPDLWDHETSPPDDVKVQKRQHVYTGVEVFRNFLNSIPDNDMRNKARNHPFAKLALDVIANHHERLDGKGENKLTSEQISMPVRLVCIVEDYDGNSHLRPHQIAAGQKNDPPSIFEKMEGIKRAGWFDQDLLEAFKTMKLAQYEKLTKKTIQIDQHRSPDLDFNLEN